MLDNKSTHSTLVSCLSWNGVMRVYGSVRSAFRAKSKITGVKSHEGNIHRTLLGADENARRTYSLVTHIEQALH